MTTVLMPALSIDFDTEAEARAAALAVVMVMEFAATQVRVYVRHEPTVSSDRDFETGEITFRTRWRLGFAPFEPGLQKTNSTVVDDVGLSGFGLPPVT